MQKPILYIFLTFIICFLSLSCQESKVPETKFGSEYSEQIKQIIDAKNAKIQAWYSTGLIDSVATHFAEDCIQMPPNQPPLIGNENFKAAWKQNIKFGKWEFDLKTEKVKAIGNLATELGTYSLSFTPNENSPIPPIVDKGSYVALWEKINNDWKIVWDAPVSELPLPSQASEPTMEE